MNKKCYGLLALLLSTGVFAQQKDSLQLQKLDEVVVSDSKFELKRENSGKTVIKITAEELEQNQGRSVAEIINTKSGIEVNGSRSYAGQNITVFSRGGNNRQILVLIDGIQVSDPSNVNAEYDLRLLNTNQIESIEILKGAASTLYGNSAATTVINITTKNATNDGVSMLVNSSMGTNQSQEEQDYDFTDFSNTITVSAKHNKLAVLASAGHQNTDGLSAAIGTEKDAYSRLDGNFKLGYQFSKRFNLTASAFYTKMKGDFDNGFPIEDADFSFTSEQSRFGLASTYDYDQGSIHFNFAFNQIDRAIASNFPTSYDSESIVLDVYNKYNFNNTFYTIVGLNVIDNATFFTEDESSTTIDPYVNAVYVSDFGLNLNIGARLNNHSEYGSNFIYNLNPSYVISTQNGYVKFLGSYSTSFIAPNLSQLFGPFGANPDLDPEEDTTIEGGFEYKVSDVFRLSALYFDRTEAKFIDYVTINPDTFESQYRNLENDINFNGVEVEVAAVLLPDVDLAANYTYTNAESGLGLRVPKSKINGTLGYTLKENTFLSLSCQYVSDRTDTDFSTFMPVNLEAFSVLNFYAKHSLNKKVSFFAALDNLFNTDYTELFDYTTRGRNLKIGMNLRF